MDFEAPVRRRQADRAAIPGKRPYLPKWLADAAVPASEGMAHLYRVVVAPSAECAINRICRLMKRGAYEFSRLKAVALRKQVTDRYDGAPPRIEAPSDRVPRPHALG